MGMTVRKVADPGFKAYGRVITGYDFSGLLKAMEHTPLPEKAAQSGEKQTNQGFPVGLTIQVLLTQKASGVFVMVRKFGSNSKERP